MVEPDAGIPARRRSGRVCASSGSISAGLRTRRVRTIHESCDVGLGRVDARLGRGLGLLSQKLSTAEVPGELVIVGVRSLERAGQLVIRSLQRAHLIGKVACVHGPETITCGYGEKGHAKE